MKNATPEYIAQYEKSGRQSARVSFAFQDGTTITTSDLSDFMEIRLDDATGDDNNFSVGSAIPKELSLSLNNRAGKFSGHDFFGCKITAAAGFVFGWSSQNLDLGTFYVDESVAPGITIQIKAYDKLMFADIPYTPGITFPCSAGALAYDVCDKCDIVLSSTSFQHSDFSIESVPENATCREIIEAIAAVTGTFARISSSEELEFRWYEETDAEITHLRTKNIATDQVTITGVKIYSGSELLAESGADGYCVSVRDNMFINANNAQAEADFLASVLVGQSFRPLQASFPADARWEAGDIVTVTDDLGDSYTAYVTRHNFVVYGASTIVCGAETPAVNSSQRTSEAAKAVIQSRRYTNERILAEQTARETAIQNLIEALAEAPGLYPSEETQPDGSTIYYFHDQPLRANSQTILQINGSAIAVSRDGGDTWPTALDYSGNAILNKVYAVGIDASFLTTGQLIARDANGNITFSVNLDTGDVSDRALAIFQNALGEWIRMTGSSLEMGKPDNPVKMILTAERLSFVQNGAELVWFAYNGTNTNRMTITESMDTLGLTWTKDEDGYIFVR